MFTSAGGMESMVETSTSRSDEPEEVRGAGALVMRVCENEGAGSMICC